MAAGLAVLLLLLLLLGLAVYHLWKKKKKKEKEKKEQERQNQHEELPPTLPSLPGGSAPVILVSQNSWAALVSSTKEHKDLFTLMLYLLFYE